LMQVPARDTTNASATLRGPRVLWRMHTSYFHISPGPPKPRASRRGRHAATAASGSMRRDATRAAWHAATPRVLRAGEPRGAAALQQMYNESICCAQCVHWTTRSSLFDRWFRRLPRHAGEPGGGRVHARRGACGVIVHARGACSGTVELIVRARTGIAPTGGAGPGPKLRRIQAGRGGGRRATVGKVGALRRVRLCRRWPVGAGHTGRPGPAGGK
jgi:hypothetical protein